MPDADRLLSRNEIVAYLDEVADELASDGPQHTVVIVGGSLLAWHRLRESTTDVDSIRRLPPELRRAAATVADRHDLKPTWLNDDAVGYDPPGISEQECDPLRDHPRLRIFGAPLRKVFLMKMSAARTRDVADLPLLWPGTGFESPEEAVAEFYAAYPLEPSDPHLVDWLAGTLKP